MKKQRLLRSRKLSSSSRPRFTQPFAGLESLEDRHLLAANVLSSVNESISTPGQVDDINLTVDISGSSTAALIFHAFAVNSSVNVAAPVIKTASGATVTPISSMNNSPGLDGRTVVELGDGEFSVEVAGEGTTTGAYRLEVSLLGDVDAADSRVSSFERLRASAALIQFMGTGNHVTDLFYRQQGINMSVSQYDTGFDINMSGGVESFELGKIEQNQNVVISQLELQADVTGPAITNLRLTNDTGTSNSDRITTDARVSGSITDESQISSVTASLDGRAAESILADLGDINTQPAFTLTRAVLDRLAGGSLGAGAHTLTINATDEFGNASSASLTFTFIPANTGPTSTPIPQQNVNEDAAYTFNASTFFSDTNTGDVLRFTATGLPGWLTISTQGVLSGTPGNNDVTTSNVIITATDSQGLTTTQPVIVVVINTPDPPSIQAIPDQTVNERQLLSVNIRSRVTDPDPGDVPNITVDRVASMTNITPLPLPAWLTFDPTTGILSGTPTQADVGTTLYRVFVVDQIDGTGTAEDFFQITVVDVGDPPVLDMPIPDDSVDQRQLYTINFNDFFSDPDAGSTLTYSAQLVGGGALPAWLTLNANTGVLSGTPVNESDTGVTLNIQVTATDNTQLTASDSYMLTVVNINDPPVVNDQSFDVDPAATSGTVVGTVVATDPEGQALAFTITGGTGQGLFNLNGANGQITVAPGANLVNGQTLLLNVQVVDTGTPQLTDTAVITINVTDNRAPVANDDPGFETNDFAAPLRIAAADLLANDTDPDNDTLTISNVQSTSARGASVTFNPQTQQIEYNSAASNELLSLRPGQQLTDTFTYTVSDGQLTDTATVSINVIGTDTAEFFIQIFDQAGTTELTTLAANQPFFLVVSVQDRRPPANQNDGNPNNDIPAGIFAAFVDVNYPANLVSVTGPIEHLAPYNSITNGNTSTAGLIDEAGGSDGLSPLGPNRQTVFRVPMVAGNVPGTVSFTSDGVEDQLQFGLLAYLDNRTVPNQQIVFGTASVVIGGLAAPLSATTPASNYDNPLDVDADGAVTLKDALIVINELQTGHSAGGYYPDVNADGRVALQDAIQVINAVQLGLPPQAALSSTVTDYSDPGHHLDDDEYVSMVEAIFADPGLHS